MRRLFNGQSQAARHAGKQAPRHASKQAPRAKPAASHALSNGWGARLRCGLLPFPAFFLLAALFAHGGVPSAKPAQAAVKSPAASSAGASVKSPAASSAKTDSKGASAKPAQAAGKGASAAPQDSKASRKLSSQSLFDDGPLAEGWERAGLFSSPLSQRIFVSKSQPEIILSLRAEPRRAAPLPDSEADFQALAESKKQLIQKIPSISSWEPELYSWTPERKTLFLKGILIRRGKNFFSASGIFTGRLKSFRLWRSREGIFQTERIWPGF